MSDQSVISVTFPDLSPTEASSAAAELEEEINRGLREQGLAQIARQQRTDPHAQNLGDVVQLLFTAHGAVPVPAVMSLIQVIALGIQKYLARTNRAHLRITQPDGTIIDLADIDSRDMTKIVAALEKNGEKNGVR
jgi:hypothetical protein